VDPDRRVEVRLGGACLHRNGETLNDLGCVVPGHVTPDHAIVFRVDDHLDDRTFFSPAHASRSLGRYAILRQVEWAREAGLPYVYLGYWIRDCRKMSYKSEYRPLEYYRAGAWTRDPDGGALQDALPASPD